VAIDAPFARRPSDYFTFTECDRADQIQLIVDLRRAVDLLEARGDVDGDRIGYPGFSYGAAMGGLLAGVEHRIAAFVVASGDGEVVSNRHFTRPLSHLPARRRQKWLAAMKPLEPLRWIGRASAPSSSCRAGSTNPLRRPTQKGSSRRLPRQKRFAGTTPGTCFAIRQSATPRD
jgi:poly(3-hydroxybutyrate) depolymerase